MRTLIFAHRGASAHAPENTMEAFRLAWDVGADGLEIDVQKSADGQLVVTHDENLARLTGVDAEVASTPYSELRALNAAAFRKDGSTAYIPLLEEVLELVKSSGLYLNIELKNTVVLYPELEEDTLAMVRDFGLEERIIFSSFNHYSIVKLKALGTTAELALLYTEGLYEPWNYAKGCGIAGLHPYYANLVIPDYVAESHALGIAVRPWTVNSPDRLRQLLTLEPDALITDDPALALALRDGNVGLKNPGPQ